jgi:hypothetical protein
MCSERWLRRLEPCFVGGDESCRCPPLLSIRVDVRDAGSVSRTLAYGVAAGAASALTPGTELCRREDVERLYEDVRTQLPYQGAISISYQRP